MKRFLSTSLAVAVCLIVTQAQAADVSFDWDVRRVTAEEAGGGAPENGYVFSYYVNGLAGYDILSVDQVLVDAKSDLYFNAFGDASAANPPNPALIPAFPALAATSYVTTPGSATSLLGTPLPGDGSTTFGDLTTDDPGDSFMFAQLTIPAPLPGSGGIWTGRVNYNDNGQVVNVPFSTTVRGQIVDHLPIPEPGTFVLAGLSLLGLAAMRKRS